MWWWFLAICEVAKIEVRPIVYPLLGAAIGAFLGSMRSWYWSRWQIGLFIGLCVGYQVDYLEKTVYCYPHIYVYGSKYLAFMIDVNARTAYRDIWRLMSVFAAIVGGSAACVSSAAIGYWIARSESWHVGAFREHPFRWLVARSTAWIMPMLLLIVCGLWWFNHRGYIATVAGVIKCDCHELPTLSEKLNPLGISLSQHEDYWKIRFDSAADLSAPVLSEVNNSPCTILGAEISGQEIEVDDLQRLIPQLSRTCFIDLRRCAVTDDGLLEFSKCPRLQRISIIDCSAVTRAGIDRFHQAKPNVTINAEIGEDTITYQEK